MNSSVKFLVPRVSAPDDEPALELLLDAGALADDAELELDELLEPHAASRTTASTPSTATVKLRRRRRESRLLLRLRDRAVINYLLESIRDVPPVSSVVSMLMASDRGLRPRWRRGRGVTPRCTRARSPS